jgi:hypothetical protein
MTDWPGPGDHSAFLAPKPAEPWLQTRPETEPRSAGPTPRREGDRAIPFSGRELHALQRRVEDDRDELTALGIDIASMGVADDCMEIEFSAADPDHSLRLLHERYGPALRATWEENSRTAEVPQAFGSWKADGTQLTVFYGLNHNTEQFARVEYLELAELVIVTVIVTRTMLGPVTAAGGYRPAHTTIELKAPVGNRPVLDAAGAPARPRWPNNDDAADPSR